MDNSLPRSDRPQINEEYYQAVLQKPLHDVYRLLEPHLPNSGIAVDLGCGVGKASLFLAAKGLEVFAIDLQPRAIELLTERIPEGARIHAEVADMGVWPIPACDVLVAGFSLFFLNHDAFADLWPRIVDAIKPGGHFAGQLLGPHDEWADKGHAVFDVDAVRTLFREFDLVHFEEVDREGETSIGRPKHWHVFHVVARRK